MRARSQHQQLASLMEGLSTLDKVAYVRFASVYKNFKEAKDFEQFVGNLDTINHNYLDLAFHLAENLGQTKLNPRVGSVVVKDNSIISSGIIISRKTTFRI